MPSYVKSYRAQPAGDLLSTGSFQLFLKFFFCILFCSYASLYFCSISASEYNMLNILKKKNFFCGQICDKKRHDHLVNLHKKTASKSSPVNQHKINQSELLRRHRLPHHQSFLQTLPGLCWHCRYSLLQGFLQAHL